MSSTATTTADLHRIGSRGRSQGIAQQLRHWLHQQWQCATDRAIARMISASGHPGVMADFETAARGHH